jgi:hypothetical protein
MHIPASIWDAGDEKRPVPDEYKLLNNVFCVHLILK